ncbi:MAG: putative deoxyribonuclease YjjV [Burkholderiaceae bacterium]|nr:putative deoxyribonuclease YjjV [Burkholderiaceae bacterium]
MWIDTHCHLEAPEFAGEEDALAQQAAALGVSQIVIPAIDRDSFARVAALAQRQPNCSYALGIHPMYVPQAADADLDILRQALTAAQSDPKLVAIGEIGMDFFIPEYTESPLRERQEHFFVEQLKLAREFNLPVLLHIRRAQDVILKHLRRIRPPGGIAHAFNGSFQQAQAFIELGFKLSFCGTFTHERAQQLRRLATELPLESLVIETDAPDLAPSWAVSRRNSPLELPRIGEALATLRGVEPELLAQATTANALAVLPRLAALTGP